MTMTRGLTLLALAVQSLPAQQAIPIRHVTVLASTDSGVVRQVEAIHVLSDGHMLLNDGRSRRLLLFDSTLKRFSIAADTTGFAAMNYGDGGLVGAGNGAILPFIGDSVAFVDVPARSLHIIDASGHFGRVMAAPVAGDMRSFDAGPQGVPGFDRSGRLYYRVDPAPNPKFDEKEGSDTSGFRSDSAFILRGDFDARRVDTVAKVQAVQRGKLIRTTRTGPQGPIFSTAFYYIVDPLPVVDEWAYLPDGTVAIARGHDYHIDWILPDGRPESGPKMPFDWRRITDAEKQHIVDSVRHRLDSAYDASVDRLIKANPGQTPDALRQRAGMRPDVIAVSELPDYYPPIRAGSQMRADPDGNLWILPTTSLQAKGGYLYDLVNRKGEIVERVQFPEGRALAGFGPKGIVYMLVPPGYAWARIERATVIR